MRPTDTMTEREPQVPLHPLDTERDTQVRLGLLTRSRQTSRRPRRPLSAILRGAAVRRHRVSEGIEEYTAGPADQLAGPRADEHAAARDPKP